jgi:hypothetical protein
MRYHNISDIFEMIEKMQRKFEESVAGLTPEQENFRPSPDRWTIAENAEHVTIVNGGFIRLTNKMLKQAEAESRPALSDLQMPPLTLTDEGEMKPGKWQAPDMVKPKGGIGVEQSVAGNRQIIDELFALKSRIDAVDLSDKKWNHPLLGDLNIYQWLVLFGEHEERHRVQIDEIKAAAGFPSKITS